MFQESRSTESIIGLSTGPPVDPSEVLEDEQEVQQQVDAENETNVEDQRSKERGACGDVIPEISLALVLLD